MYARKQVADLLPAGIGMLNHTYLLAIIAIMNKNKCQEYVLLTKHMLKIGFVDHRKPKVDLFLQSVKPGVFQTNKKNPK